MVIGLTGGIASGKGLVARMLVSRGAIVIDADEVSRDVMAQGTPTYHAIADAFGPGVIGADGEIDRGRLGRRIFASAGDRELLERLTHPQILTDIRQRIRNAAPDGVVVLVAPLLLETGSESLVDEVWLVTAPPECQVARVMDRDGLSEAEALARISAQWSQDKKRRRATRFIDNSGSEAATAAQVEAAWQAAVGRSAP